MLSGASGGDTLSALRHIGVLDQLSYASTAAALRIDCRRLAFSGSPEIARKLADMAEQAGARLEVESGAPHALFLDPGVPALEVCRAWLAGSEACDGTDPRLG